MSDRFPRDYDDAGVKWKPLNAWCDYWGRPCPKSGCDCIIEELPDQKTDREEDDGRDE